GGGRQHRLVRGRDPDLPGRRPVRRAAGRGGRAGDEPADAGAAARVGVPGGARAAPAGRRPPGTDGGAARRGHHRGRRRGAVPAAPRHHRVRARRAAAPAALRAGATAAGPRPTPGRGGPAPVDTGAHVAQDFAAVSLVSVALPSMTRVAPLTGILRGGSTGLVTFLTRTFSRPLSYSASIWSAVTPSGSWKARRNAP